VSILLYKSGGEDLRLYISLCSAGGSLRLPQHYNYLVQGFIYNNLGPELASFLHGRGYISGVRSFKLFAFSRLAGLFKIDKEKGEIIFPQEVSLVVSSPSVEFCTSLLNCLLSNGSIYLGMSNAEITGIKVEKPEVEGEAISLKVLSPIVTYSTFLKPDGGKYTCYFQPGEKEFALQIGENLRKKYQAFYNQPAPTGEVEVKLRGTPKMNLVSYKGIVIRGYSCRLQLSGPRELLQMGLEAGLGAKNSQGFGCVEVAGE